jgi:hypothetical protein
MHEYGDEWFEKYGDELHSALSELSDEFKKNKLHIYLKEKYGCLRSEIISLWDGGIFQPLFGYCISTYTYSTKGLLKYNWARNLCNGIRRFIRFKLDLGHISKKENETLNDYSRRYEKRLWKGLSHINMKIGLVDIVNKKKIKKVNEIVQKVCAKHPDIVDEIIMDLDFYEWIKPCEYGNVDGVKIHEKYWKPLK